MPLRPAFIAAPLALAFASPIARSQPAPSTPALASTSLADRPSLARLVDLAAARAGLSIEYDPALLGAQTTLRTNAAIPDADLWPLVNRLLAARGLTTVQLPGSDVFSVVKIADAAPLARVQETLAPEPAPGFQSVLLRPRHRSAKDAAEFIKPLLTKSGGAVADLGPAGMLLVSDLTPRIEQARRVLALVDVPGVAAAITEVPVSQAPASAVIPLARQIAAAREAATGLKPGGELLPAPGDDAVLIVGTDDQARYWRSLLQTLDRPEVPDSRAYEVRGATLPDAAAAIDRALRPARVPTASPDEDAATLPWSVVANDAAGLLTITTVPSRHARIAQVLAALDAGGRAPRPLRAFPVRNRPAADVLDALSALIDAGAFGDPDADRREVAGAGEQRTVRGLARTPAAPTPRPVATTRTEADTGQPAAPPPLRLTADEATNTIIAVGDPRLLAQVESLLTTLDVRQPQVMLEAMLVSLNDSEAMSLGVELERLGSLGDAAFRLSSLFGLSSGGAAARTVGDAAGFTGAVLNPGEYSVIVRALEAINKGGSVSMPRVLVTNNEQATFSSVLQQPILETTRSDNSTSTSFAGTEDAGTTISIKPQIARGDHLVLTYQISLSSFVGSSTAAGLPPPKQQNKVDSVATIPDGHTVVVGGLELTSDSEGIAQLPLIARIPLLGELFKNRATARNRTRFFVFIRATVLRSTGFDDLRFLSTRAAAEARLDDGLPVVQPRVIR